MIVHQWLPKRAQRGTLPSVTKRGVKRIGRVRSAGIAVSKGRVRKELERDSFGRMAAFKKLKAGGLPHRKAIAFKR